MTSKMGKWLRTFSCMQSTGLLIFMLQLITGSPCRYPGNSLLGLGNRCIWVSWSGGNLTQSIDTCTEYDGFLFTFNSSRDLNIIFDALNITDHAVFIGAIKEPDKNGLPYDWLTRPGISPFLQDNSTIRDWADQDKHCVKSHDRELTAEYCAAVMNVSVCERNVTPDCPCNFTIDHHSGAVISSSELDKDTFQAMDAGCCNVSVCSNTSEAKQFWDNCTTEEPSKDAINQAMTDILLVPDNNGTKYINFSSLLSMIASRVNLTTPNQGVTGCCSEAVTETQPVLDTTSELFHVTTLPSNLINPTSHPNTTGHMGFPVSLAKFMISGQSAGAGAKRPTLLIDKYQSEAPGLAGPSDSLKNLLIQTNVTKDTFQKLSTTVTNTLHQSAKTQISKQIQEDLFSDIMKVGEELVNSVTNVNDTIFLSTMTIDVFSSVVQPNSSSRDSHVEIVPPKETGPATPKVKISGRVFNDSRDVRVSTIVYKTNVPGLKKKHMDLVSSVISVTVSYVDGNSTDRANIKMENALMLILKTSVEQNRREQSRHCTYWDFSESAWLSTGCRVVFQNSSHTGCSCDHLTNFAILVMYMNGEKLSLANKQALFTLTTVGCSLSIACLAMTIIAYIYLRVLGNEKILIHANLSLALILAQLVFVSSSDAHNNQVACKVVAVLLHFLFMASFTWMLVEGIALYLYCTKGIFDQKDMRVKYFLLGWGLPLIIVLVSFAAQFPHYGEGPQFSCWLSVQNGLIWAFLGPMLVIILLNMFVLGLVVRVFLKLKANSQKSDAARLRGSLRAMLTLLPLLGLTWLLSLLVPFSVVFHYFFVITNTLQGMLIFFLHCLCNDEIRKKFQAKRRRWSSTARTGSDIDSSYAARRRRGGSFDAIKHTTAGVESGRRPAWT